MSSMQTVARTPQHPGPAPRVRERARDAVALVVFSALASLAVACAFTALTLLARTLVGGN